MYKTYLINLDRATERLNEMDRQLAAAGMVYERVSAVDGKALVPPIQGFDEAGYKRLHGRRFHPGEVGCYLSHMKVLRLFLDSDAEHALILEDDAELASDLPALLQDILGNAENFDVVRLSSVSTGWTLGVRSLKSGHALRIAMTRFKGSAAYLVNRKAAGVFLSKLDPARMAWDIAFDIEYLMGLRAAIILPLPVNQINDRPSQVQVNNMLFKLPASRYLTVLPWRVWLEGNRIVRRFLAWFFLALRGRTNTVSRSAS